MEAKEAILNYLLAQLDQKIGTLNEAIENAKESRDNETKSSVGDKYETGRSMVQMEIDKNLMQLTNLQNQKNDLLKIDVSKKFTSSEFGSILLTNRGNYFLSIGYGKVEIDNKTWFCISVSSPVEKQLVGKQPGDKVLFSGNEFVIQEIS